MLSLPPSPSGEYCCDTNLNLYDSPSCEGLATQASRRRHLRLVSSIPSDRAIQIALCEDGYVAWLPLDKLRELKPAAAVYQGITLSRAEIEPRISEVIAFAQKAIKQPNIYLWGGTIGPNYDCSGLIQAAFAASGIWLPRDSYQQEAFTKTIQIKEIVPGDLIFFGQDKVNHVALYLGNNYYIHSSGKETGRNGIGIDQLSEQGDKVSKFYYQQFWSCGRIMSSYSPK